MANTDYPVRIPMVEEAEEHLKENPYLLWKDQLGYVYCASKIDGKNTLFRMTRERARMIAIMEMDYSAERAHDMLHVAGYE